MQAVAEVAHTTAQAAPVDLVAVVREQVAT
jgi:hypothetical protein